MLAWNGTATANALASKIYRASVILIPASWEGIPVQLFQGALFLPGDPNPKLNRALLHGHVGPRACSIPHVPLSKSCQPDAVTEGSQGEQPGKSRLVTHSQQEQNEWLTGQGAGLPQHTGQETTQLQQP